MNRAEEAEADPSAAFELLSRRVSAIPGLLSQTLTSVPPAGVERVSRAPRFVVTGGGLSEGPARVLVALLQRAGRPARFVPQSTFAAPTLPGSDPEAALLLFSQGLAPNARLPLAHLDAFGAVLVFTAVPAPQTSDTPAPPLQRLRQELAERGVLFWEHPPLAEDRLLLRVIGPAAALACCLRFVELLSAQPAAKSRHTLPARYAAALATGVDLFGECRRPIALIADEELGELAFPLRWKLLEGLRVPDPAVWDLLQIVHGPLQAFYPQPQTLVAFERAERPHEGPLLDRLATLLDKGRHRLLRLPVSGDPAEALLLLDAQLNASLLQTLKRHPLALDRWPLQGADDALYAIDPAMLELPGWHGG